MPEWAYFWDDFWNVWKAASIGLAGLFGILGLLTAFKDEATGKITVWGKINLVGIVLSAIMGVLAQLHDAQRQTESAEKAAAEAQASAALAQTTAGLAQTSATKAGAAAANTERLIGDLVDIARETRTIASGTERSVVNSRSAAKAGQQAASATLGVARGTALAVSASQAGLVRIERLVSPFEKPTIILSVRIPKKQYDHPDCPKKDAGASVTINVGRTATQNADYDITYKAKATVELLSNRASICYFKVTAPLQVQSNAGALTSYLDLPGKTLFFDSFGLKIFKEDVEWIRIQTPDGQYIVIPSAGVIQTRRWNPAAERFGVAGFGFHYTFPPGRDPRAGAER